MIRNFYYYIKEENLVSFGDVVIAGVSGGADSVCLLYLLKEVASEFGLKLIAAHVNHGMRETAKRDEDYVRSLSEKWDIPFKYKTIDVKALAKENGESVEEAGRNARYAFFRELLKEAGGNGKIATAHHRDDNCETILFNLIRGSALTGLIGMKPISEDGEIIRPLLWTDKEKIEVFLSEQGIEWMTDETNSYTTYARNKLRQEVFPVLAELSPAVKEHMTMTAMHLAETEDYLKEQTDICLLQYVREIPDGFFIEEGLLEEHPCIVGRVLYNCLVRVAGKKKDIARIQVNELNDLFYLQVGRKRNFLYGILASRTYGGVELTSLKEKAVKPAEYREATLPTDQEDELSAGCSVPCFDGLTLKLRLISYTKDKIIPDKIYTKWFDYDKINNCPNIRTMKEGDYLVINSDGNRKSLKEYYKNEKIPSKDRGEIPVIAEGSHVLWVIGHRMSQFYQVDEHTTRVLEIQAGGKDE